MSMQCNLNDRVWVELTSQGREMYSVWVEGYRVKHMDGFKVEDRVVPLPNDWTGPLQEEPMAGPAFVSCQLYDLMCIFGPFIGITSRTDIQPFKDNQVHFSPPFGL